MDELQAAMIVVPSEVLYQPKFTYIWTLGVGRFPEALRQRVNREVALREIARCFLTGAGMTIPGEMARVTGLSRVEAGRGNRGLAAEGYATTPAPWGVSLGRGTEIRAPTALAITRRFEAKLRDRRPYNIRTPSFVYNRR